MSRRKVIEISRRWLLQGEEKWSRQGEEMSRKWSWQVEAKRLGLTKEEDYHNEDK